MAQRFRELAALLETQVQFPAPTWQSTTVHDSSSMCVFCLNTCLCTTCVSLVPVETEEGTGSLERSYKCSESPRGGWKLKGALWKQELFTTHSSPQLQRKKIFLSSYLLFFKLFYSFYTRPQFPLPSLLPTSSPSHPTIHSSENVRPISLNWTNG